MRVSVRRATNEKNLNNFGLFDTKIHDGHNNDEDSIFFLEIFGIIKTMFISGIRTIGFIIKTLNEFWTIRYVIQLFMHKFNNYF